MKVLGIDPGLHIVGYAVIEFTKKSRDVLLEAGVIRTAKARKIEKKLEIIHTQVNSILDEYAPSSVAVEDLFSMYEHPKPAILMGHARGVIFLSAAQRNMEVVGYTPTKVKKFLTGNGHATKIQMQRMVKNVLNLKDIPKPPDVADAIAIALCHANHLRRR